MGLLIDTQVLVALERSERDLERFLEHYPDEDLIAVAAITASELLFGIYRADTAARRLRRQEFVEGALATLPTLPFDLGAARIHARVSAELSSQGSPTELVGPNDLLIGATAIANDCGVLTGNVRHFSLIPGLNVLEPNW